MFANNINQTSTENPLRFYYDQLKDLPIAIYTCDAAGYVTEFNESAAALWGNRPAPGTIRWCGAWKMYDTAGILLSPEAAPIARTFATGSSISGEEVILERPDGSRSHVIPHPSLIYDEHGAVTGAINILTDITAQRERSSLREENEGLRRVADQLRRSEERYHRMTAQVEDYAIILLSHEGLIENWNKGAEKIKGYSEQEVIGKSFKLFYTADDQHAGLPDKLLQIAIGNGKATHEGWRMRKDGSKFWGSVVLTTVYNDDGSVLGFTKVTRDLTERKLAEEKLRAASLKLEQKNKELEMINEHLSSFAYISSHDLQEPLRKIQTFSDRILDTEYDKLSEKGKDYLLRMQAGASRMQKLIRDILAYSRTALSEKKLELADLNELLNHAMVELEVMILEKKAVIESDQLPDLMVIPFQIQQLFNNLLNNALKFSKPGVPSHIRIKSEVVSGQELEQAHTPLTKEYLRITFQDNGIGFEPEYSKKIFEVFQRLHGRHEYGGTGIGLAICKKIVENHSGFLSAESTLGDGAAFHIYLPMRPLSAH